MDVDRLTRWQEERRGERPPAAPRAEVLADLRKAVGDATDLLRALTFTYLAAWAYIVVAAGSVDDRQLLVGTSIQLPLLGTGVGLTAFFWMAPALFLVLHGNVLLQLYLLARRLRRFDEAARLLPEAEQAHARTLLTPFPFVEWRAGRETARAMHATFALTNWALYVVLPLFLFLWVQLKFLPYQAEWTTFFHLAVIGLDLLFLWLVWPRLNQAQGGWRAGVRELQRGAASRWMLRAAPFASLLCLLASFAFWFDQHPPALAGLEPYVPAMIASFLDYRWSRITVTGATLMKREPAPEIVAQFRREAKRGKEDEGEHRAYLDPELAEPLDLAGRSLRRADFSGSKLWKARFVWAQLQGANLDEAQLQGADLIDAQLQGADLINAQLQGADLISAHLQGAVLDRAQLQGAFLYGAEIFIAEIDNDTDLSRVDLRTLEAKPLIPEARAALKAAIEQVVTNPHMQASALGRLAPVLARPPPTWTPGALPQDKRRDVLASENLPDDDPVRKLTNGDALVSPRDDGTYGKALAEELARLACAMDDTGIGNSLVGRMSDLDEGAYLPDLPGG